MRELMKNPLATVPKRPWPAGARQRNLRRFAAMMSVSEKFSGNVAQSEREDEADSLAIDAFENVRLHDWIGGGLTKRLAQTERTQIVRRDNRVVGIARFAGDADRRSRLIRLMNHVVRLDYVLDTGIPYLVEPTVNVLLVDEMPRVSADARKAMRAAAIAGWAIVPGIDRGVEAQALHELESLLGGN